MSLVSVAEIMAYIGFWIAYLFITTILIRSVFVNLYRCVSQTKTNRLKTRRDSDIWLFMASSCMTSFFVTFRTQIPKDSFHETN